jgi:hypothetical protein
MLRKRRILVLTQRFHLLGHRFEPSEGNFCVSMPNHVARQQQCEPITTAHAEPYAGRLAKCAARDGVSYLDRLTWPIDRRRRYGRYRARLVIGSGRLAPRSP